MTDKTIEQLCKDLEHAKEAYRSAEQRSSFARNEATDALNRLNQAQKALEARMLTLAKDAPHESDWGKKRMDDKPLVGSIP